MIWGKHLFRDCSGAMTVEFVVVTPMLLAAMVFAFELGRGLWAYDVMSRDVRAGVRYLSRAVNALPVNGTCPTAATTLVTNGTDASAHFPWNDGTPTFACNETAFASGFNQSLEVVTMQAQTPVTLSFLDALNRITGTSLNTSYTLEVQDQAQLVGN
jgi:Flp pilus assembly protein TadG